MRIKSGNGAAIGVSASSTPACYGSSTSDMASQQRRAAACTRGELGLFRGRGDALHGQSTRKALASPWSFTVRERRSERRGEHREGINAAPSPPCAASSASRVALGTHRADREGACVALQLGGEREGADGTAEHREGIGVFGPVAGQVGQEEDGRSSLHGTGK